MIKHPWIELQALIKEKWLTQKAFASILWKKVSEVNELLKWKRNITIQRDYLLHQTLWTPMKYRILKQVDYDYSLIDIDEEPENDNIITDNNEESVDIDQEIAEQVDSSDYKWDYEWDSEWQKKLQETPLQEPDSKDDEDYKKRARIFKSF